MKKPTKPTNVTNVTNISTNEEKIKQDIKAEYYPIFILMAVTQVILFLCIVGLIVKQG